MDGFWCSRCLNDHIEVPDMMRLFAGGATTPLVVKFWTKQPWLSICATLITILRYLEAKFDYVYFIFFCNMVPRFHTKNLKSFWPKMKERRQFSQILIWIWIGNIAFMPWFLLEMTWIFCVELWNHNAIKI